MIVCLRWGAGASVGVGLGASLVVGVRLFPGAVCAALRSHVRQKRALVFARLRAPRPASLVPERVAAEARLGFLNWMAPCTISAKFKEAQARLLGTLVSDCNNALALVLSPTFTHYKGQLWMQEQSCNKSLANQGLNLDKTFMILLKDRQDARDSRPLNLIGRMLVPANVRDNFVDSPWKNCSLVRKCRTEEADQIKASPDRTSHVFESVVHGLSGFSRGW